MTRDVKESLTAVGSVLAILCFGFFTFPLLKDVDVPEWAPLAGVVLSGVSFVWSVWDHVASKRRSRRER
jgi:protein-S-isoprenylcysteine O-methyltransferase Ste14